MGSSFTLCRPRSRSRRPSGTWNRSVCPAPRLVGPVHKPGTLAGTLRPLALFFVNRLPCGADFTASIA